MDVLAPSPHKTHLANTSLHFRVRMPTSWTDCFGSASDKISHGGVDELLDLRHPPPKSTGQQIFASTITPARFVVSHFDGSVDSLLCKEPLALHERSTERSAEQFVDILVLETVLGHAANVPVPPTQHLPRSACRIAWRDVLSMRLCLK